jgi:hypothetical protein
LTWRYRFIEGCNLRNFHRQNLRGEPLRYGSIILI